jgi:4-hydroxyphenylpyruvate dioxygenase
MNAPAKAYDNPLGLDGFEFVEFTSPDPEALAGLFTGLGFTHMGNHKTKNVRHYAQGDINFILNMEPSGRRLRSGRRTGRPRTEWHFV